jgi:hypothetical protein
VCFMGSNPGRRRPAVKTHSWHTYSRTSQNEHFSRSCQLSHFPTIGRRRRGYRCPKRFRPVAITCPRRAACALLVVTGMPNSRRVAGSSGSERCSTAFVLDSARSTPSQSVGCRTYADAVYPATWSLVTPFKQRGQHARRVRLCLNPAGAVDICEHLGFHRASIDPGRGTLPRLWLPVSRPNSGRSTDGSTTLVTASAYALFVAVGRHLANTTSGPVDGMEVMNAAGLSAADWFRHMMTEGHKL